MNKFISRKKIINSGLILILIINVFAFFPSPAQAAMKPIMEYTSSGCQKSGDCSFNDAMRILNGTYQTIFGLVGSVALLFFIYGGVMFLISGGNEQTVETAKKILTSSVIGLLIIFGSFLIIDYLLSELGVVNEDDRIENVGDNNKPWYETR